MVSFRQTLKNGMLIDSTKADRYLHSLQFKFGYKLENARNWKPVKTPESNNYKLLIVRIKASHQTVTIYSLRPLQNQFLIK